MFSSEASLLLSFPHIKISQQQDSTRRTTFPHLLQRAACGGERSHPLPCLRCPSTEHSLPQLFLQPGVEKVPQSPSWLAAILLQSSRAPRDETYQILTGQNRNGPWEEILFHSVPAEGDTFRQPLIRENIIY